MVRNREKNLRLLMIEIDPWKPIDRERQFNEVETIFEFQDNISRSPQNFAYPRHYSPDKIRNVQILVKDKKGKFDKDHALIATLVI